MTYLEWLSEKFRRGEGFAEENARRRQERLAANNGQERPLVSLPHYLAALWNGQGASTTGNSAPQAPSAARTSNQTRSQGNGAQKMVRPALGEPPKAPAPPPEAYQKAGSEFQMRSLPAFNWKRKTRTHGHCLQRGCERFGRGVQSADQHYVESRQQW